MRAVVLAAAPIGSIRDDADQEISAQNAAHADAIRPEWRQLETTQVVFDL